MAETEQGTAVRDLDPATLAYVAKVRRATGRLAAGDVEVDDVRAALEAARAVAGFDVEAPTESPRREVRVAKTAVKRMVAWYVRYLSEQLNSFSAATLRLSETLATRVEKTETSLSELAARVEKLEAEARGHSHGASQQSPAVPSTAQQSPAHASVAHTSTAPQSSAQRSTASRSTAQRSTAQRSTAQRSTAQRSTTEKSTAQRARRKQEDAGVEG
jgi:hypothetical protein